MKQNAVIYIRVSTVEQVTNLSLSTQEQTCREFCTANNLTVIRVFRDAGESAKTADRAELKVMLAYCADKTNGVRHVIVYNTSRFSRNVADFFGTKALLARANITFRAATEPPSEGSSGFLSSAMFAVFAEWENQVKAERTIAGMKAAIAVGRWTHGAPLGYLTAPKIAGVAGPSLIPDKDRAEMVRFAFNQIALGISSQAEVLAQVTAMGLKSKAGKRLSPQSFHKMLRKPIYAGRISVRNLGENLRANFEPLVPPETFDQVQALLAGKRSALKPRLRDHDFPLRVFTRCGCCGTPVTGSWSTGRSGRKYGNYSCRKKGCRGVKAKKDDMEGAFVTFLEGLLPKPHFIRLFREVVLDVWKQKEASNLAAAGALQEQVEEIRRKIERLEEDYAFQKKVIDGQTYTRLIEKLRQDLLLAQIEQRKAEVDGFNIEVLLSFAEHMLTNAAEMWLKADLSQRKRLQYLFFPAGVTFLDGEFGTEVTCPLFSVLRTNGDNKECVASPRGFEP